jgi:glycopeptide antibiotics resistance protein
MRPRERVFSGSMFPTRRAYGYVALCASLFAVYVSVVPFDFRFVAWDDAWMSFRVRVLTLMSPPVSRTNFLANILLFIPIGFFGTAALLADRSLRPASAGAVLGAFAWAGSVSLAAEFLQVFEAGRVPAAADVWAQAAGAIIGIAGWLLVGADLTAWLRAASTGSRDDRLVHVLGAYVIVWIFVQLAPFDVTLNLPAIARRLRALLAEPAWWRESGVAPARAIWNAAATTLAAAPIGAAGLVVATARGQRRSIVSAVVYGSAVVALIEAVQLLVISRAPSVRDLLFGCGGIVIGALGAATALARDRVETSSRAGVGGRIVLGIWTMFVVAYHWQPYDFTLDSELVRLKLESMSLVPLAGYYRGTELNAFSDLLLKVCLSVPLGAAAGWAMFRRVPARVACTVWFVLAICVFSAIEAGQLLLPSRVPDPSDVLIGAFASSLGVWVARWMTADTGSTIPLLRPPGRGSEIRSRGKTQDS